jgi:hypothetical protein
MNFDLKGIAELITAIAALVAAVQSWRARKDSQATNFNIYVGDELLKTAGFLEYNPHSREVAIRQY